MCPTAEPSLSPVRDVTQLCPTLSSKEPKTTLASQGLVGWSSLGYSSQDSAQNCPQGHRQLGQWKCIYSNGLLGKVPSALGEITFPRNRSGQTCLQSALWGLAKITVSWMKRARIWDLPVSDRHNRKWLLPGVCPHPEVWARETWENQVCRLVFTWKSEMIK